MEILKSNHYIVNTDIEMVSQLFSYLEEVGITKLEDLEKQLLKLKVNSFNDLLNYTSGPDCEDELAIIVEEVIDRLRLSEPKRETIFTSSREVGHYLADKLAGHKQEEFWTLYLDNSSHIVAEKKISQGTLDKAIAHPRDVFRWAVVFNCAGMIVAHNHPSGKLLPSNSDFKMTRQLKEAAKMMKIDLLDHFIVGKGQYLSMKEHELF
ncbi:MULTISPECIES: RadC family protein [Lactobacillus]|uniref:JAB domain-containing protein n=1 Tax=Lactobacillus TaxID=1578 RepID=UPI000CD93DA0|nr:MULTISPECIES: DNA repair protein RadC [Lactobacillus]RVU73867.1 DNA repair protein RadC [Lactobacillus xujianguonis]